VSGDRSAPVRARLVNETVQRVLIVGLAAATIALLAGLGVDLAAHQGLPRHVLKAGPALRRAAGLHGDALLTLGLLALILTPFLRVAGMMVVFAWERDWRYTLVALFVLAVMIGSLFLGGG
jgi:uncharacterized membrane protein